MATWGAPSERVRFFRRANALTFCSAFWKQLFLLTFLVTFHVFSAAAWWIIFKTYRHMSVKRAGAGGGVDNPRWSRRAQRSRRLERFEYSKVDGRLFQGSLRNEECDLLLPLPGNALARDELPRARLSLRL